MIRFWAKLSYFDFPQPNHISLHLIETDRLIFHQAVEDDGLVFPGNQGKGVTVSGLAVLCVFNSLFIHNLLQGKYLT